MTGPWADTADPQFVQGRLGAGGWYAGRRIDPGQAVAAWAAEGISAHDAALAFVEEFDGVRFEYPMRASDSMYFCHLNASLGTRSLQRGRRLEYVSVLGDVCPVGIAASGHLVLMIDVHGQVFGGYDNFLARYGDNGYQALASICLRDFPAQIAY